jgi:hypothetical protein
MSPSSSDPQQSSSCTIVVCNTDQKEKASQIFHGTGIKFAEGSRDLGGVIASSFIQNYVTDKISSICKGMENLSRVAESSAQAVHAAYEHGVRHR